MESLKTSVVKPEDAARKWHLIDAAGKPLGRVAAKAAAIARGKEKPQFTLNMDCGDYVVIINAEKALVTGRKRQQKLYHHHSGYPGGLKTFNYEKIIERRPTYPMEKALRGMLPRGPLGRKCFGNVKIYAGTEHPHSAQNPVVIEEI